MMTTERIDLERIKAATKPLTEAIEKHIKTGVKYQNALDIASATLYGINYQTAKGRSERDYYAIRLNMGTRQAPMWVEKAIGHCDSLAIAHSKAAEVLSGCTQFHKWELFRNDAPTHVFIDSTPSPESGFEYQIVVSGETLGDIELALEEVVSRIDNVEGFDRNESSSFHFVRVGSESNFVHDPDLMSAPWFVNADDPDDVYIPASDDDYTGHNPAVRDVLLDVMREGETDEERIAEQVKKRTGIELEPVPEVLRRFSSEAGYYCA